jgi:hypothetical protein
MRYLGRFSTLPEYPNKSCFQIKKVTLIPDVCIDSNFVLNKVHFKIVVPMSRARIASISM